MYLIPYFFGKPLDFKPSGSLHSLWIFMLEGGKQFWKTDSTDSAKNSKQIAKEYFEENGIHGRLVCVKGDCLFYEVDRSKTQVTSFYTWPDMFEAEEKDGWRGFFWLRSADEAEFKFGKSLDEISIPPLGSLNVKTVKALFDTIEGLSSQ